VEDGTTKDIGKENIFVTFAIEIHMTHHPFTRPEGHRLEL
jgi:hypothetical protein